MNGIGLKVLSLMITLVLVACQSPTKPREDITTVTSVPVMTTPSTFASSTTRVTEDPIEEPDLSEPAKPPARTYSLTLKPEQRYQTMRYFGGSGAWWAQDVGLWDQEGEDGRELRETIAEWLFDPVKGIGLKSYRYNIGAGSAESEDPAIQDHWRRAQTFETAPGVYDWTKDEGAQWMLREAVRLGVEEVTLFMNSAPERMKKNGRALDDHESGGNFKLDMVEDYARYGVDIAEHFLDEGIPVRYISPVNEPSWPWTGGQEGTRLEPSEVVAIYEAYVDELDRREALNGIHLSGPEMISVNDDAKRYINALMRSEKIKTRMDHIANHVYGSDATAKRMLGYWFKNAYPDFDYKMSEWTEMENGMDTSMDSGMVLAKSLMEDVSLLNASAWEVWILVSRYSYHDGLVYVDPRTKKIGQTKRLWTMGNFSRFIQPGDIRIGCKLETSSDVTALPFVREDDGLTIVLLNESKEDRIIVPEGIPKTDYEAYCTSRTLNLEPIRPDDQGGWRIPAESVVTIMTK